MNRALPMFTHPLLMIRPILMVCALLLAMASMAQGRFTVNGRMKVDGSDMSGTRVVVYKNGVKERTLTSGLAKFSLDLDLQASYILSFEKDGFVAKKLSFNTKVPGDAAGDAFTPFDFGLHQVHSVTVAADLGGGGEEAEGGGQQGRRGSQEQGKVGGRSEEAG
jgi:hypothetical protein